MLKFNNLTNLVQVFANEFIEPRNLILLIGEELYTNEINKIFEFIDTDAIYLTYDINDIPYEDHVFDAIISFNYSKELFRIIKNDGVILINEDIINGKEKYQLNNTIFTVI